MQVFETLETAAQYRELMTQQLKTNCPDLVTLDGGRISSKGITSGSSFQVLVVCCTCWHLLACSCVVRHGHEACFLTVCHPCATFAELVWLWLLLRPLVPDSICAGRYQSSRQPHTASAQGPAAQTRGLGQTQLRKWRPCRCCWRHCRPGRLPRLLRRKLTR